MDVYLEMIDHVLTHGIRQTNRTGVDTLAVFNHNYSVDISERFPLLTTKDMSGFVWDSLIHELVWYLSGDHHIHTFSQKSKIWDAWADDNLNLETAYGRFWRRFPIPEQDLPGEAWADRAAYMTKNSFVNDEYIRRTFDQIAYIVETLRTNPQSRRMVLTAWHPANAAVSKLPPCHYTACFSTIGDRLNCHLTQRSGDLGLGIPFNIASYSALTYILAKAVGMRPGTFAHTIVDLHIYCGDGEDDPYSHVGALKEQLQREPRALPKLEVVGDVDPENPLAFVDNVCYDDFVLDDYNPHPRLRMKVAV